MTPRLSRLRQEALEELDDLRSDQKLCQRVLWVVSTISFAAIVAIPLASMWGWAGHAVHEDRGGLVAGIVLFSLLVGSISTTYSFILMEGWLKRRVEIRRALREWNRVMVEEGQ